MYKIPRIIIEQSVSNDEVSAIQLIQDLTREIQKTNNIFKLRQTQQIYEKWDKMYFWLEK